MSTTRRRFLSSTAAACGLATAGAALGDDAPPAANISLPKPPAPGKPAHAFRYCLNMATIRGQKLGLTKEIETAAKAGYEAVEPWMGTIEEYVKGGGSLKDMAKRITDLGMTMESAIGFANWVVDDDAKRAAGLEQARRDLGMVAELGGRRLAAPPAGATNQADLDLRKAAERYAKLCDLGQQAGITPMVEIWGFSKCLNKVADATFVALESGHPRACVLPDIYHLFKGGSATSSMNLLSAACVQIIHMNDYPADLPREKITDADRIYPGDGIGPIGDILRGMVRAGSRAVLSLELFNRTYWAQDALEVAKTGLAKTKAAVAKALA